VPPPLYARPYPPRRKKSKAPLVIFLVALVLLGGGGLVGAIVYFNVVRPKQFVTEWGRALRGPEGMYRTNGDWVDRNNRRYYAQYQKNCANARECLDPTPVKAVTEWLHYAGDTGISERMVAECFGGPTHQCQRLIYKDSHKGVVTLSYGAVLKLFTIDIELFY
jgi:hypothetical protein